MLKRIAKRLKKPVVHSRHIKRVPHHFFGFVVGGLAFILILNGLFVFYLFFATLFAWRTGPACFASNMMDGTTSLSSETVFVIATAYSSTPDQTDESPCITADGFDLCAYYEANHLADTIAANFLPLGTVVKIPELYGDRLFEVRDRMNSRYGYGRIDLWMPSRFEAKRFGTKYLKLEIYK